MNKIYNLWLDYAKNDSDLINELNTIKDNEAEIKDRFYRNLEFGTAGLRGIIGAGTNRMNIYVVRQATQGLADYILQNYKNGSVAISYDSRIKAKLFAENSARVLAANGIKVYLVKELQPTPVLSFLVRHYKCSAGIMVTASHNPADYNGYKVYGSDGCQMTTDAADAVYNAILSIDMLSGWKICDYDSAVSSNMIEYVDESVYDVYLEEVKKQQINPGACKNSDLKIAFTPLNGTGNKLVRKVLAEIGAENISVVKEQEEPDGNFTTCSYPNPELPLTLKRGLELAKKEDADILLATDPDADRVGVAIKSGDGYRQISGNETGILLADYILSSRKARGLLPKDGILVKTIVSSVLVERIAADYNIEVKDVLTGFKYIGEVIFNLEQAGKEENFLFGFEESCGYLAGSYVRDKDAIFACMLFAEMAAFYKKQNKTVAEVLDALYEKYGYYKNTTLTFSFPGKEGADSMKKIMKSFRTVPMKSIANYNVIKTADYQLQVTNDLLTNEKTPIVLPKSDVISFSLSENNSVIIRPSGTEPKIKMYVTAVGTSFEDAEKVTRRIIADMMSTFGTNPD